MWFLLDAGAFWMENISKPWEWPLSVGDWISLRKLLLIAIMFMVHFRTASLFHILSLITENIVVR